MSDPDSSQVNDIGLWLESIGMGEYAETFNEHHLTLEIIDEVTDADLKECGISSMGHRKQILAAIQQRKDEAAQSSSGPATETSQSRKLGHFELLEQIGSGGMGTVYRAWDSSLNRQVAIKVLDRDLAADQPQFFADFIREAQNAAGVNHAHIVQIYFVGEDAGDYYIAMELLEGQTLDERLKRGPLDQASVLNISRQIVEALAATNARRLIHGDIKPHNIFLTNTGDVKLLDFGLARKANTSGASDGEILGSAYYLSPERACGYTEDFRSDIYSLGATMFYAISGMYPFEADDVAALVRKRVDEDAPRLRSVKPTALPALDQLFAKMLARDPADRHQGYQELLAEIAMAEKAIGSGFDPGKKLKFTVPGGVAPVAGMLETVAQPQVIHAPQSRVMTHALPSATGALAAAVPATEQPQSKRGFWMKLAGSKILVMSIILHLLFAAGATLFIVQRIQAKRKLVFQGGPGPTNPSTRALEHKVNMSRKQQTMSAPAQAKRITTTGVSKISLPDMPSLPSATELTPGKMGGMGGTGMGFGAPGGGGGGGGGTGKGLTMFGLREGGNGLPGTFYDLKQTRDRKPTGFDPHKYADEITRFNRDGWNPSLLEKFFKGPQPLYAQQIFIPSIPADEGPKAFGLEKDVMPRMWVVHYKGSVSPAVSGRYHFVGGGDDVLMVRFNGHLVFARNWDNPEFGVIQTHWKSQQNYDYNFPPGIRFPNGFGEGEGLDVIGGLSYPIEVLIGEQPGGLCSASLLIKKEGESYEKDSSTGLPIFPVFRLTTAPLPPAQDYAPHSADTAWSVWKNKPTKSLGF